MWSAQAVRDSKIDHIQHHLLPCVEPKVRNSAVFGIGTHTHIGETCRSLSDCMNGHSLITTLTYLTYLITVHVDCKSMNLIYQLQFTECNAFLHWTNHCSLTDCMNGHFFTAIVSNPGLLVAVHTQSHQIPFQDCWSIIIIHKPPYSTPDHICCQFEIAYQLVLQSHRTLGLNIH